MQESPARLRLCRQHEQRASLPGVTHEILDEVLGGKGVEAIGPIEIAQTGVDALRQRGHPAEPRVAQAVQSERKAAVRQAAGQPGQVLSGCDGCLGPQRGVKTIVDEVSGIGIVFPGNRINRVAVGPQLIAAPDEVGDGVGHLLVAEAETKAAPVVDPHQGGLGQLVRTLDVVGRGRCEQKERRGFIGLPARGFLQFARQFDRQVARIAADDRQGRRLALRQSLYPIVCLL